MKKLVFNLLNLARNQVDDTFARHIFYRLWRGNSSSYSLSLFLYFSTYARERFSKQIRIRSLGWQRKKKMIIIKILLEKKTKSDVKRISINKKEISSMAE